MALIGTIRKHSALTVVIIGVAMAAFVLSDLFTGNRGGKIPSIGVIAGEDISATDYNRKVDENIEIQRINQGKENLTQEEAFDVRVSTWNQFTNEIIMGKEYENIDLSVTTDEVWDLVQGPNPHQLIRQYFQDPQTGIYNPQVVLNFLQNLNSMTPEVRAQWMNLENFIKEDRLNQKYTNLVSKGYFIPDAFASMEFEARKKTAEIRYVSVRYTSIPDSLALVSDKDYQKYYEENEYQYDQDASRDIDYIIFEVLPSAEDRAAIRGEIMSVYDEFQKADDVMAFVNATSDSRYDSTWHAKGDLPVQVDSILFNSPVGTFVPPYEEGNNWHMAKLVDIANRPDSMKAEHILIAYQGAFRAAENITRTKIQAEALADSLLQVVKTSRDRMQELAGIYSDDGSARENKGDLGWFADGAMVYPFNQAVVDGNVGDIVRVETVFGIHVIKITGKKPAVKKVRVAMLDRQIEPSSRTYQDIYTEASIFAGENNTREKFDQKVTELGLNKRTATYLREMSNSIPGIPYPREIVRWAFTEGINVGEVSPVFDVGGSYVVATLTASREKGKIPLAQIKDNIRNFVMNEKKAEYIINKINSLGGDIYQIAAEFNTKVDTNLNLTFSSRNIPGFGSEFKVIGAIFATGEGGQTGPIQGNGAVFVVNVDKFFTPSESSYSVYRDQIQSAFRSRANASSVFTSLLENTDIEDNRLLFF